MTYMGVVTERGRHSELQYTDKNSLQTLVHVAAAAESPRFLSVLFEAAKEKAAFDLEAKDGQGYTPLMLAVLHVRRDQIPILFEHKAHGESILNFAVTLKSPRHRSITQFLFENHVKTFSNPSQELLQMTIRVNL